VVVGDDGADRAYIFADAAGHWRQAAVLEAPGSAAETGFGVSVAASGGTVVVGRRYESYGVWAVPSTSLRTGRVRGTRRPTWRAQTVARVTTSAQRSQYRGPRSSSASTRPGVQVARTCYLAFCGQTVPLGARVLTLRYGTNLARLGLVTRNLLRVARQSLPQLRPASPRPPWAWWDLLDACRIIMGARMITDVFASAPPPTNATQDSYSDPAGEEPLATYLLAAVTETVTAVYGTSTCRATCSLISGARRGTGAARCHSRRPRDDLFAEVSLERRGVYTGGADLHRVGALIPASMRSGSSIPHLRPSYAPQTLEAALPTRFSANCTAVLSSPCRQRVGPDRTVSRYFRLRKVGRGSSAQREVPEGDYHPAFKIGRQL
jgi:hypothetical protein